MKRGRKPRVPIDKLIADYQDGATLREIGARYGYTYQAVESRLKRAGIELRPRTPPPAMRTCPACQRPFAPSHPDQIHCSQTCRRGTHNKATCKKGHPLTPENLTPRYGSTPPRCRECVNERARKKRL